MSREMGGVMEAGQVIVHIVIAAFAVFGLYCLIKLMGERFGSSSSLCMAITVHDAQTAENLDLLLCEADRQLFRGGRRHIVVLFSSSLMKGCIGYGDLLRPDVEELIRHYHAECYVVSADSSETKEVTGAQWRMK